jgi:hypothetical protein
MGWKTPEKTDHLFAPQVKDMASVGLSSFNFLLKTEEPPHGAALTACADELCVATSST